ncbi:MAG: aldehyde dehydrogenase (NADP(+)) [Actinomycetota bacterium]|nr:aldehyde dehydrogenase (NADP(+)) [Actinomycetota bacterium]
MDQLRLAGEPPVVEATPDDVDAAARAATAAFDSQRDGPTFDSSELLASCADELDGIGEQIIAVADEETGLGIERLTSELGRTTGQLRAFAALVRSGEHLEAILDRGAPDGPYAVDMRRMNVPIGPVAVWAASNFPLAFSVAGGDTASAFAAGCPVVVKAHPAHWRTSRLATGAVERAVRRAGAPDGWFATVHATAHERGRELATHPGIRSLAFTGSARGGRALWDAAAARPDPIPVFAEMGSLNPVVLTEAALRERADEISVGLASSLTMGAGQFCTKPGLVLVTASDTTDRFLGLLAGAVEAQPGRDLLYPALAEAFRERVGETLRADDVTVLAAGGAGHGRHQGAWLVRISGTAFLRQHAELAEEHFGPFGMVVVCADRDELEAIIEVLPGTLTATMHAGRDEALYAGSIVRRLAGKAGRVVQNGWPTGVQVGWATVHGGPWPATTASASTSVGLTAVRRFQRPVAYQSLAHELLPAALQDANPLGISRIVDGERRMP